MTLQKKISWLLAAFFLLAGINLGILYLNAPLKLLWVGLIDLGYGLLLIYACRAWLGSRLQQLFLASKPLLNKAETHKLDIFGLIHYALDRLKEEQAQAIGFIHDIGKGKLEDSEYASAFAGADEGSLGAALLSMRDQLKEVAEREKERAWVSEGLANFSDLLRKNSEDLTELGNELASKLTKYLNANQAAIFILQDEDEAEPYLELTACFAYDRRKFVEKRVQPGEGLLGQTFLEKESVLLTDLPKNYTRITSGLGEATPGCLLIVPIKLNDEVLGMLELASFKKFQPYQIEFIEKMSEGVASAISATKIRARTAKLLEESQNQTQELQAQEEEMRQNMEELQATQEASYRMQEELRQVEQEQRKQIEELSQAKITMQEQETQLKASQEKAQKRSLRFKEKMEQLDIEIEGKNARIKTLEKQMEVLKKRFDLSEEELLNLK